jgi:acyl-coenzyme A thioesterase PaaI-like protein
MGAVRNGTLQAMFAATDAPISDHSVILAPEVGWTSVDFLGALAPIRSLVSGDEASDRIRIAYFRRERDRTLVGKVWFGPGVAGPTGHAQAGSIAAVLDEAMGAGARMAGHLAIASTLRLRFRLKVPLRRVMILEASVRAAHGPRLHVNAKVCDDTGAPFAEGSGLFIRIPPERDRAAAEM